MPHQVLCPILQEHLLADPCGFHTVCPHHDQLALKNPFGGSVIGIVFFGEQYTTMQFLVQVH
jgi:hypothetical protein